MNGMAQENGESTVTMALSLEMNSKLPPLSMRILHQDLSETAALQDGPNTHAIGA
jgi:hypothetical protein